MKILTIGDVVGEAGLDALHALLRRIKRDTGADFVIVNGENAAGNGVLPRQAEDIFDAGADVVTLGNHAFGKQQIVPYLDEHSDILRPANLAPQSPGQGWGIFDGPQGSRLLVIDLIGRCDMKYGPDNPFLCVDRILKENEGRYDVALVEFHANATSEKLAMGYYLDGRVSAVWGTHTHVQTADERVNPKGTGYITDLGMTGPYHSVLGVRIEQSIAMFRGDLTEYFKTAPGDCAVSGAVFEIEFVTNLPKKSGNEFAGTSDGISIIGGNIIKNNNESVVLNYLPLELSNIDGDEYLEKITREWEQLLKETESVFGLDIHDLKAKRIIIASKDLGRNFSNNNFIEFNDYVLVSPDYLNSQTYMSYRLHESGKDSKIGDLFSHALLRSDVIEADEIVKIMMTIEEERQQMLEDLEGVQKEQLVSRQLKEIEQQIGDENLIKEIVQYLLYSELRSDEEFVEYIYENYQLM